MTERDHAHTPKVFSDEEIEMFLAGDRRQIDRHMLYCLNRIAEVLIKHTEKEDAFQDSLAEIGGEDAIKARAEYVDSLIKKNNRWAEAFEKISQSTITWALIAFLGFLAMAVWHDVVAAIRTALKVKGGV